MWGVRVGGKQREGEGREVMDRMDMMGMEGTETPSIYTMPIYTIPLSAFTIRIHSSNPSLSSLHLSYPSLY